MLAIGIEDNDVSEIALEPMTQPRLDRFPLPTFCGWTVTSAPASRAAAVVPSGEPSSTTRTLSSCASARRATSHVMQAMTAAIVVDLINGLDLQWPTVSDKDREANARARQALESEPE